MKFALYEKISIKLDAPLEAVTILINRNICMKFLFFPDKILTGELIKDGKLKAVINPPIGWSDPFKSRISGSITTSEKKTALEFTVKPSLIIIGFLTIWIVLIVLTIISFDYKGTDKTIGFIGLVFCFTIFLLLLSKLKIVWDSKRFNKWVREAFKQNST
jgi:hypothetical protein